jgi:hypothetical protein
MLRHLHNITQKIVEPAVSREGLVPANKFHLAVIEKLLGNARFEAV